MTAQQPTRIYGHRYQVVRELGAGSMGSVFEVAHLRMRRHFALKLLRRELANDPEALARFQREAEVTSGLGHPHIVEIIDFDCTEEGERYLVMELIEGEALSSLLARQPRLELDRAAGITLQIASALQAAHEQGIIHRDLKPQNIMICSREGKDHVKVLDFGVSKVLGARGSLTGTTAMIGTPLYMSPEQAAERAAEVDPRSDIFSLGSMLYCMLAGQPAFAGSSAPAILYKVTHERPPDLRKLRPDLPASVVKVVERALRKEPEKRFPSMRELAAELARAAGVEQPAAPAVATVETAAPERTKPIAEVTTEVPEPGHSSTLRASTGELLLIERSATRRRNILIGTSGGLLVASLAIGLAVAFWPVAEPKLQHTRGPSTVAADTGAGPVTGPLAAGQARAPDARPAALVSDGSGPALALDRSPSRVATPRTGVLQVSVTDEHEQPLRAWVYVDGRRRGECCPLALPLAAGRTYKLEVRQEGFRPARREVSVAAGRKAIHFLLRGVK